MNRQPESEKQFQGVIEHAPDDLIGCAARLAALGPWRPRRAMPLLEKFWRVKTRSGGPRPHCPAHASLRGGDDPQPAAGRPKQLGESSFQRLYAGRAVS
jgi:hypothetical protein